MPEPARILYDSRWAGPHGIGRFATEVCRRVRGLAPLQVTFPLFHPLDPWRLAREVRRIVPPAFFSPGFNAPLATPGVPLVFTVHDLNYVHFAANTTAFKRAYFALIVKPACRRAARVLTVSEFSRRQILEWAGIPEHRVVNVGNGVDASFTPTGERHSPGFPYVLFVGSLAPHKNFPRLARALAQSKAAREVKLLVTGNPNDEIARWIEREKLQSMIRFAGVVPDAGLPQYYRGAVALAMPSLFEGFGLPVVEAMACGTPVITSTGTSLPEVAGDAALLVEPTNTEAIADALEKAVFDAGLRASLSERGIVRARRFNWDNTAAAVSSELSKATTHRA